MRVIQTNHGRPKEVFIVEDDPTCKAVLKRTIQAIDADALVTAESSAEEALYALDRDREAGKTYDLIIADIFLAGERTGLELWLRCRERYPNVPVLITSSLPIHRFFETVGPNEVAPPYLAKPFYVGECRQIIAGLLDSRHRA